MTDPSVSSQAYQYFEQEATELLQTMNGDLQTLRQDFSVQKVHNLMRAAHTLKGASASVGLDTIKKTTHSLEDVFRALCHQDTVISVEMERLIFEGFECLQLLMSAQLAGAKVDGADILDRMATVVTQLQKMLGDRFGQGGHLPTSSELGFDMTQSIFELGVAQRLEALSGAVNNPDPQELLVLLKTQAGVFNGLGESLKLPGFQAIAQATLNAIAHQPEQILHIAPVALENFKVAHAAVLKGDRTQGGSPSAALKQFCAPSYKGRDTATGLPSLTAKPVTTINPPAPQAQRGNWLQRRWKKFTHSEAASVSNPPRMAPHSPAGDTLPTAATESSSVESNSAGPNSAGPSSAESSSAESASNVAASNISTSPNAQQEVQQKTQQASPKATEFTESDLAELAPT
ncbi:MAG: Hpt domain-containing protein, partial [Cyanobacteria bacterium J06598_3]